MVNCIIININFLYENQNNCISYKYDVPRPLSVGDRCSYYELDLLSVNLSDKGWYIHNKPTYENTRPYIQTKITYSIYFKDEISIDLIVDEFQSKHRYQGHEKARLLLIEKARDIKLRSLLIND